MSRVTEFAIFFVFVSGTAAEFVEYYICFPFLFRRWMSLLPGISTHHNDDVSEVHSSIHW
jgi:hypothetical protein